MKTTLIKIRNKFHYSNRIKVSRNAKYSCKGNLLKTRIILPEYNEINLEENCRIRNATIIIKGSNNSLRIGEHSFFSGKIELFGSNNNVEIGKNTRINGADLICHHGTSIKIGDQCLFSKQIDIRTTDSHYIYDEKENNLNPDKSIYIENNVWLGRMVNVTKGSEIGEGSVVGTMSLVNCKLSRNCIYGGVPAKKLKENIHWRP